MLNQPFQRSPSKIGIGCSTWNEIFRESAATHGEGYASIGAGAVLLRKSLITQYSRFGLRSMAMRRGYIAFWGEVGDGRK
jgi:hypothetical protein